MKNKCDIKKQENCEVEKRGCEGCYYNIEKIKKLINKKFNFKIKR